MSCKFNVEIEDFKNLFTRDFPYLPFWENGQGYFKEDIVYFAPNFYISLVDGNTDAPPLSSKWKVYKESVDNYIQDSDIERAFLEAKIKQKYGLIFSNKDNNASFLVLLFNGIP